MALGKRLINTGAAAAAACTTDSTDPFGDSSGVALYNLDYDASDASGSYDGTPTDVTFGVGGQILYGGRFNGSSSNIQINQLSGFTNYNFTLSIWIKTTDTSAYITSFRDPIYITFGLGIYSGGTNGMGIYDGSNSYFINNTAMQSINDGDWHHIVMTHDGANLKGYIDKLLIDTVSTSTTTQFSGGTNLNTIGKLTGGSYYYDGDLDQVRIFSKALNQTEVDTLYAETACTYTATTTDNDYPTTNLAYYKLDNSAEDEKGSYDGTETDIEYRFGRYGQAAKFPALASSYINTGITSLGSNFSLSFWFNPDYIDGSSGYRVPLGKYWAGSGNAELGLFFNDNGTVATYVYYGSGYSSSVSSTHPDTISNGNWYHYCITWENGVQLKTYLNNVSATTTTSASKNNNNVPLYIGALDNRTAGGGSSWNSYAWSGLIDQVRIFQTALSDSQVTELYNEKPEVDTSNFKAVLWDGTSAENYISQVGMDLETNGGLVWIKQRSSINTNHRWFDSIRGVTQIISSSTTDQQASNSQTLKSFEANGFFLGTNTAVNDTGDDFVAWNWKAGGEAVQNTQGDITSDVSANTAAGFSIVKYTGNGGSTAKTVGHGLSSAPEIIIAKGLNSSSYDWAVYSSVTGNTKKLALNQSTEAVTSGIWNDTTPTTSVFSVRYDQTNETGTNFIAYCWHSVAGYSKIGTYEGDNTNDYSKEITGLGFDPSFVMVKNVDSSGSNWEMIDIRRGDEKNLYANESYYENANSATSYGSGKFITDGFEVARGSVSSSVHWNRSNDTYIYMAFK